MPCGRLWPSHRPTWIANSLRRFTSTVGSFQIPIGVSEEEEEEAAVSSRERGGCSFQNLDENCQVARKEVQRRLEGLGISVDSAICAALLRLHAETKSLSAGKRNQDPNGLDIDKTLCNLLVQTYIKCGALEKARLLAAKLQHLDVPVWNSLIRAYAQRGNGKEALELFNQMQRKGVFPDKVTFINSLSACTSEATIYKGKFLHELYILSGYQLDVFVGTALITMYGKCGSPGDARRMFDKMEERNVVSWTAQIDIYSRHGHGIEALQLFDQMGHEGVMANRVTFLCLLDACASQAALFKGKEMHTHILSMGMESHIVLMTALLNMYGKCGSLDAAQSVFYKIPERDAVSWNALIAVYAQQGCDSEAIQLFDTMQHESVIPDLVTFVTIISSCASKAALPNGKRLHTRVICNGFEDDAFIATALLNMYGKWISFLGIR